MLLGTPLGTPAYVQQQLTEKSVLQQRLLAFINRVAADGHRREANAMLTKSAVPSLSYITQTLHKDAALLAWAQAADAAHRSAFLRNLGAPHDLEEYMDDGELLDLTETLDLPPQFGGEGLASIACSADEAFLGNIAAITADFADFLRSVQDPLYSDLADALMSLGTDTDDTDSDDDSSDSDDGTDDSSDPVNKKITLVSAVVQASERTHARRWTRSRRQRWTWRLPSSRATALWRSRARTTERTPSAPNPCPSPISASVTSMRTQPTSTRAL